MFSVDDSFDFEDEEFVKVAQDLELDSPIEEPPTKRRSFEITFTPTFTGGNLDHKENRGPTGTAAPSDPLAAGLNGTSNLQSNRISSLTNIFGNPVGVQLQDKPASHSLCVGGSNQSAHTQTVQGRPEQSSVPAKAVRSAQQQLHPETSRSRSTTTRKAAITSEVVGTSKNPIPFTGLEDLDDLDLELSDPAAWDLQGVERSGEPARDPWVSRDISIAASGEVPVNCTSMRPALRPAHRSVRTAESNLLESGSNDFRRHRAQQVSHQNEALPVGGATCYNTPQSGNRSGSSVNNARPVTSHRSLLEGHQGDRHEPCSGPSVEASPCSPDLAQKQDVTRVSSIAQSLLSSKSGRTAGSKRKRKFPGPAGLLPRLKPDMDLDNLKPVSPAPPKVDVPQKLRSEAEAEVASSQGSEDVFADAPWRMMKSELEPRAENILNDFSLPSVVRKAGLRQLPRGKVPVVAAIVDAIQAHVADASAVLRDAAGTIKGTIHRQLLKDHGAYLTAGCVLVLRQVGVFSPSPRNHYLNITPSNVVRLYARDARGNVVCHKLAHFTEEDFDPPPALPSPGPLTRPPPGAPSSNSTMLHPLDTRGHYHHQNQPGESGTPLSGRNENYGAQGRGLTRGGGVYQGGRVGVLPRNPIPGPRLSSPQTLNHPHRTPEPGTYNFKVSHTDRHRLRPPTPQTPGSATSWRGSGPTLTATAGRGSPGPNSGPRSSTAPSLSSGLKQSSVPGPSSGPRHKPPAVHDLWEDDQLDDLMTGIDEEMLVDF